MDFDTSHNSWFYIKQMVVMPKKEWHGNYYLKAGGYMAKMNGFMITIIRAGSISRQMVLMQNKNGRKSMANGTISRSGAIWLKVSGKEIIS